MARGGAVTNEKRLGARLQEMRRASGLTQQTLCQKAGLSYSTLTKIERGAIKSPSIFTIQRIADAVGVGLDELLGVQPPAIKPTHTGQPTKTKQRSKNGISFVYFDINGCLVRFYQRAFVRLAEVTGAPADTIETTFWHYNDAVCRGDMSLDDFNQAFAAALGVQHLDWMHYYLEAVEPIVEMQEVLKWVSEHYRIGLLTNIMPGFVAALREHSFLPDVEYDVIVDSSVVHAIKPEDKMYKLATEKAHCPANEILLVDDARSNVMAAEKAGWHVLWFDDYRVDESAARIHDTLALE